MTAPSADIVARRRSYTISDTETKLSNVTFQEGGQRPRLGSSFSIAPLGVLQSCPVQEFNIQILNEGIVAIAFKYFKKEGMKETVKGGTHFDCVTASTNHKGNISTLIFFKD